MNVLHEQYVSDEDALFVLFDTESSVCYGSPAQERKCGGDTVSTGVLDLGSSVPNDPRPTGS